eukprot:4050570-Lingulodinium_polyedra.AAC.1
MRSPAGVEPTKASRSAWANTSWGLTTTACSLRSFVPPARLPRATNAMPGDMTLRLPVVMCPPRSFKSSPGRRPSSHCSRSEAPA